jgi:hypothetical protein
MAAMALAVVATAVLATAVLGHPAQTVQTARPRPARHLPSGLSRMTAIPPPPRSSRSTVSSPILPADPTTVAVAGEQVSA